MDHQSADPPITDTEYDAIEAAMLETARGRWFLAEFARRNRTADTNMLLGAIERLEQAVSGRPSTPGFEGQGSHPGRFEPDETCPALARAVCEVAASPLGQPRAPGALGPERTGNGPDDDDLFAAGDEPSSPPGLCPAPSPELLDLREQLRRLT